MQINAARVYTVFWGVVEVADGFRSNSYILTACSTSAYSVYISVWALCFQTNLVRLKIGILLNDIRMAHPIPIIYIMRRGVGTNAGDLPMAY